MFCKKYSEFTGKTLELEYLFNLVSDLRCYRVNLENFLRTTVFQNYIHLDSVAQKLTQSFKTIYSHSPANFAISFSSEKIKRENDNFKKM